ncbi:concanavalin A-like lectin/glucanase domain-containing protein [Rhizophagus clarus]|nr:concanavalin A-like lectin/glucanase domain-containing protein [Rhizophagus clarus]
MFCNIFKFDYQHALNVPTFSDLGGIFNETNEIASKKYISQYKPVVIILGMFQFTFIVFCILFILLLKKGSWKWIKKTKLNNGEKKIYIVYQLENTLLLIVTSFLGTWILMSEVTEIFNLDQSPGLVSFDQPVIKLKIFFNIFGIITIIPITIVFIAIQKHSKILYSLFYFMSTLEVGIIIARLYIYSRDYFNFMIIIEGISQGKYDLTHVQNYTGKQFLYCITNDIIYREKFFIAIPTLFFLITLNINTILCQKYQKHIKKENEKFQIKDFFKKKIFKKILKFLEPDEQYSNILDFKEWKFTPNLSLSKIITIENNMNIIFNTKTDVMIQTNYPLFKNTITLNMDTIPTSFTQSLTEYWFYYYEITVLSNPNIDKTIIAIGLTQKNHSINRLPGCDIHSIGFHSDEGKIFHNEGYTGLTYAEKWGEVNDVIGCGYYSNFQKVFFTKNGKNLGTIHIAELSYLSYIWFPTIGSNSICNLKINFGQEEFIYKEAKGMSITGIISKDLLNRVEESENINIDFNNS